MRHSWYFRINSHFNHTAERKGLVVPRLPCLVQSCQPPPWKMIVQQKEVSEDAFKPPPSWGEGWESDSQDLQSMRRVTDSLPWVDKPLWHVYYLAPLLHQPVLDGQQGWGGLGSPSSLWEGREACSPAGNEERMRSMLMPAHYVWA